MVPEFEACYQAVRSRDARFDGWFVVAVTSTGIYCRPSCPALVPKRANVRFLPTAAAAQAAGFRACKRCRPDAAPGSPAWNGRADVVARAVRLIGDGVVDRDGVPGLARRLGYSERQLHRQLSAELGVGALALARAHRAQTARLLLETTDLPAGEVAAAAGFASVRRFNATVREVFALTPTELRRRAISDTGGRPAADGSATAQDEWTAARELTVRLPVRQPFAGGALLAFLGHRTVAGLEEVDGGTYRHAVALAHGPAVVALDLTGARDHVRCSLRLSDVRDLGAAVGRCRRLLDLDADPVAIDAALGADPVLRPLISQVRGRRVAGCLDGVELAVRALLGQQVSVAGARTATARLVARYGVPLPAPVGAVTHLFPAPAALVDADLPGPDGRRRALHTLARALADGSVELGPGADPAAARVALLDLPGIGPWTVEYVAMRALGDPDAFPVTDLGVRRSLQRLGLPARPSEVPARARAWRPWRAYATAHLWAALADGLPGATADPATRAAA